MDGFPVPWDSEKQPSMEAMMILRLKDCRSPNHYASFFLDRETLLLQTQIKCSVSPRHSSTVNNDICLHAQVLCQSSSPPGCRVCQ